MGNQFQKRTAWLNYHHLYYFLVIAKEGGIAKAAKQLSIGQSALSIQLKQFEDHIGVKLFDRSHKRLILTEHGRAALEYAQEIFKLGDELLETLNDRPTDNRVHLQIGALDTIPKHLTVRLTEQALNHKPCTISIFEGRVDELVRELVQHRLDLLITNRVVHGSPGALYVRKIANMPLLIIGSRKFLPLKKNFPRSLDGAPFILPTQDSQVRFEIEHYCKLHGLRPDFVIESQDMIVKKFMTIKGLGLMAAPRFAVQEYLDNKELFVIGQMRGVHEELFLVAASRKIENPIATHLMAHFHI